MHRWLAALGILPLVAIGCDGYSQVVCEGKADSTGLAACEDGTMYRPAAMTCETMGPATSGMACTADEHCSGFGVAYCLCGPEGGTCQFTFCRSDDDCADGYACAALFPESTMLLCQTPEDECMRSEDCGDGLCTWDGFRRYCQDCDEGDCAIMNDPVIVPGDGAGVGTGAGNAAGPLPPRD
jgi:hypothetical protein